MDLRPQNPSLWQSSLSGVVSGYGREGNLLRFLRQPWNLPGLHLRLPFQLRSIAVFSHCGGLLCSGSFFFRKRGVEIYRVGVEMGTVNMHGFTPEGLSANLRPATNVVG
jgi:hypothetical protein